MLQALCSTGCGLPGPRHGLRAPHRARLFRHDHGMGMRMKANAKDEARPSLWSVTLKEHEGPDFFPELVAGEPLPEGPYGIGEIGAQAFRFVNWVHAAGQQIWQILPLCPPETEYWSPYSGLDALCGNPLLIPLDELVELGLLSKDDLPPESTDMESVDYPAVHASKMPLLEKAARALLRSDGATFEQLRRGMAAFRAANPWVEQSALFSALTELPELRGKLWWHWPAAYRDREPEALDAVRAAQATRIDTFIAIQFLFEHFWNAVKSYANAKGISVVGDMPIYVSAQSADVWANRHLFALGPDGAPREVSGVPPDAFSETGQLWGSPLYDWEAQAEDGYRWWIQRFRRSLQLYDEVRVDHFRAFAGFWAVKATESTALNGVWKKGPGVALFQALKNALGPIPIIAEDLGVITPDVTALREAIGAPGMIVLQFAWGGGPTNTHLPHNIYENSFVYPGTHDNQTVIGWWRGGITGEEADLVIHYIGHDSSFDPSWAVMRAGLESCGRTVVTMMQDIMRCDDSARMNTPGIAGGNWKWRLGGNFYTKFWQHCDELLEMTRMTDRVAPDWVDPRIKAREEQEKALKAEAMAKAAGTKKSSAGPTPPTPHKKKAKK